MIARWGVALLVIVVAGCGGPALPTPTPTPLTHATGERDLLLRMSVGGGLPNPSLTFEDPPRFSLFGNGRLVQRVVTRAEDGTVTADELRQASLSADDVDALLRFALNEGGLATALERYRDVEIFDAVTTVFEIRAGGVQKTVAVYALGMFDENAPSAQARAGFKMLVSRLRETGATAVDLGRFEPEAYRVTLVPPFSEQQPNAEWPWPELRPADFPVTGSRGERVGIVTAEQGAAVLNLGITHDLVVLGPDGEPYMIRIYPLLPHEVPD